MRYFDLFHPASAAFYFLSVLLLCVFSPHPALPLCALCGGLAFLAVLRRGRLSARAVAAGIGLFLLIAVTNPLFVHKGKTVLFMLGRRAVTLEALLYGVGLAVMLAAAMVWSRCFDAVMTSDKLMFLLGRLSPKTALLFSSALRFVPLFRQQAERIRTAQRAMGLDGTGGRAGRLRAGARTYSALVTWSLENAVDTGAAMKGRGFGLKGRTAFSLFHFGRRDVLLVIAAALTDILAAAGMACGRLDFAYYPLVTLTRPDALGSIAIAAFAALSFLPVVLEGKEELRWHCCRSKI